jgi:hypothetical protein
MVSLFSIVAAAIAIVSVASYPTAQLATQPGLSSATAPALVNDAQKAKVEGQRPRLEANRNIQQHMIVEEDDGPSSEIIDELAEEGESNHQKWDIEDGQARFGEVRDFEARE